MSVHAYQLVLLREQQVVYPLTKTRTSFGRAARCDVRIYDPAVSGIHAELFLPGHLPTTAGDDGDAGDDDSLRVRDQQAQLVVLSPNGVLVNNELVKQSQTAAIEPAAVIDILGRKFRFSLRQQVQPVIDTPKAPEKHKMRQSMVQRAVLDTPARTGPSSHGQQQKQEQEDLMQWSDEEDEADDEDEEVSIVDKAPADSDSDDSGNEDGKQLTISPRPSSPAALSAAKVKQTPRESTSSDEEVENSLLMQQSPPQTPVPPQRPKMHAAATTSAIPQSAPPHPSSSTSSTTAAPPMARSSSYPAPNTTPRRRASLREKVLIRSAVKAAHRRRSMHDASTMQSPISEAASRKQGEVVSDSEEDDDDDNNANSSSSSSDLSEVSDEETSSPPQSQGEQQQEGTPAPEFAQFFVASASSESDSESEPESSDDEQPASRKGEEMSDEDGEELAEMQEHQFQQESRSNAAASQFSSSDDEDQTGQHGTLKELSAIDPELLALDKDVNPSAGDDDRSSAPSSAGHADQDQAPSDQSLPREKEEHDQESAAQPTPSTAKQVSEPPMEAAHSPSTPVRKQESKLEPQAVSAPPSSARARRAARRSSGVPASEPTAPTPSRKRASPSPKKDRQVEPADETVVFEGKSVLNIDATAVGREPDHDKREEAPQPQQPAVNTAENGVEQSVEVASAAEAEAPAPVDEDRMPESIPSDLAEFRREMALEASGQAPAPSPAPAPAQSASEAQSTPVRPRPAAPRKSALKNPNSRPTSPTGTPGSVLGKRKVIFNDTTEFKEIASIHDEAYKREQREMCFVKDVKRRRTSSRLSTDGKKAKEEPEPASEAQPKRPEAQAVPEPAAESSQKGNEAAKDEGRHVEENPFIAAPCQAPSTPIKSPSKARRVPTKTPPAAVARAAQENDLNASIRGDGPEKPLPKPSRSMSPLKRSKEEAQLNMAQLLASPAPKLQYDVFKAPPKTAPRPQTQYTASSVNDVRNQLENVRRMTMSASKAPHIQLSPASFGLPAAAAVDAPPSPSPAQATHRAPELKVEETVKEEEEKPEEPAVHMAPTAASFTPHLSGVKQLLQLPAQPPKTPSFAGLKTMFQQPLQNSNTDWTSYMDTSLLKSPAKAEVQQSANLATNEATLVSAKEGAASANAGSRARRVPSSTQQRKPTATASSLPQGVPRRATRAASGTLRSTSSSAPSAPSSTASSAPAARSRTGPAATATSARSARATPASTAASAPATRTRTRATPSSSASAPASRASSALASAPPKRSAAAASMEQGKENRKAAAPSSSAAFGTRRTARVRS